MHIDPLLHCLCCCLLCLLSFLAGVLILILRLPVDKLSESEQVPPPCSESCRLYMVATTGCANIRKAALIEGSMARRMTREDMLVHVAEPGCESKAQSHLQNVIFVPDRYSAKHSWSDCLRAPAGTVGRKCDGYELAQLRFLFSLVFEFRQRNASGAPMPRWWMIKDDDTYVNVPNLMSAVDDVTAGERNGSSQLVSFGVRLKGCFGICGGGGWLLSAALAEVFVRDYGEKSLEFMWVQITKGIKWYDVHIPRLVGWVKMAKLNDMLALQSFGPGDSPCLEGTTEEIPAGGTCSVVSHCKCARSPAPGSWHMKSTNETWLGELAAGDFPYATAGD